MSHLKPHPTESDIEKCDKNIKALQEEIRSAQMLIEYYKKRKKWNKRLIEEIEIYVTP